MARIIQFPHVDHEKDVLFHNDDVHGEERVSGDEDGHIHVIRIKIDMPPPAPAPSALPAIIAIVSLLVIGISIGSMI